MNGLERKTDRGVAKDGGRLRTGDEKQENDDDGKRQSGRGGEAEKREQRPGF